MFFPILVAEHASCGLTFAQKTLPQDNTVLWRNVRHGNGQWVAIGSNGPTGATFAYSAAGESWTQSTTTGLSSPAWTALATDGAGVWAALPDGASPGYGAYSTDNGVTWTQYSRNQINVDVMSMTHGAGYFVVVGNIDNQGSGFYPVYTSTDGGQTAWVGHDMPGVPATWSAVGFGGSGSDTFLAVQGSPGSATDVYATATDPTIVGGAGWVAGTFPISKVWTGAVWNGRVWLVISTTPTPVFLTSPDGVNWTQRDAPATGSEWVSCTANDTGTLIVVAQDLQDGCYCSTDDGATWNLKTLTDAGGARLGCGSDGVRFAVTQLSSSKIEVSQSA